jgi:parvulin-like peptidyl-prolyl isomerase
MLEVALELPESLGGRGMAGHRIVGLALVIHACTLAGCESSKSTVVHNQFLQDPEVMAAIARNGAPAPGIDATRGQKPDVRPASLLDVPPERPADVTNSLPTVVIRAVVNGQAILDEEVRASGMRDLLRANQLPEPERSRRTTEIYNETLNSVIEREVVLQDAFDRLQGNDKGGSRYVNKLKEAAKDEFDKQVLKTFKNANHFKTDEEVKRAFTAETGLSLSSFRRQWERNFMEFEYLRTRIFPLLETRVNHKMIADYYETHPEEFQVSDSVKWQDLFVACSKYGSREEARAHAESVADQARKGADFAKLVKEHDDGDSSLRGGDGVGSKRGEIRPAEAEPALFKMSDGQVGALIEMQSGFHIIKLVHRQVAGQLPFDDKVQKQIRDKLRGLMFEAEKKRIVQELKRKAVVEYAKLAN